MSAKVIQVIETTIERRGAGKDGDPIRIIRQYWSFDGALLAEVDPWKSGELRDPNHDDRPGAMNRIWS